MPIDPCPALRPLVLNSPNFGNILPASSLSSPIRILYVSMRSRLILLNANEYKPSWSIVKMGFQDGRGGAGGFAALKLIGPLMVKIQTSFTLSWCTYLLARYPAVQRLVYEEIVQNLGSDVTPTAQDLSKLPLVRGVLKETLRLFPVLPGNGRVTQEDMIVGGYFIPSG
eukprot:g38419.t1